MHTLHLKSVFFLMNPTLALTPFSSLPPLCGREILELYLYHCQFVVYIIFIQCTKNLHNIVVWILFLCCMHIKEIWEIQSIAKGYFGWNSSCFRTKISNSSSYSEFFFDSSIFHTNLYSQIWTNFSSHDLTCNATSNAPFYKYEPYGITLNT